MVAGLDNVRDSGNELDVWAERKVSGGKLIKVELVISNESISKASITGDFFAYPESFIEDLEVDLKGKSTEPEPLAAVLKQFLADYNYPVEFIGIDYNDIIELILECLAKTGNQ
ncbi:MAG: hypothetical protein JSV49_00960 [Thermoplasmata archaeon]|nr:MAG: hypothetical protein JSV49_00960 [Thermoplasmata archaeon]